MAIKTSPFVAIHSCILLVKMGDVFTGQSRRGVWEMAMWYLELPGEFVC